MIRLSNGHQFEYITASGAMGYDGKGWPHEQPLRWLGTLDTSLFTHVMKSVTLEPRVGNFKIWKPWDCVKLIWRGGKIVGVANAFGLTNPGFKWWLEKVGKKIDSSKNPVIASIFGEPHDLAEMAIALNDIDVVGLTYNASCPNAKDDTLSNTNKVIRSCEIIATESRHPLLFKASVAHDIKVIIPEIEDMIEALKINSVPWNMVFPNTISPLVKFGGGGVSGKIAQPITWAFASELQEMTKVPVIVPSIWDYENLAVMRAKGFKAFSFGSVFIPYPWRPTQFLEEEMKKGYPNC
jgi:dihydroorotate dehydrogenase